MCRHRKCVCVCVCGGGGVQRWGGGPHDAGNYNSRSWETGFFKSQGGGGRWQSHYGHFFQSWYRCAGWGGFGLGANVCHSYTLLWLEASGCCHAACAVHGLIVTNCDACHCCCCCCSCVMCSGLLVRHARRVLGVAAEVLNKPGRPRVMKACKEVRVCWGGGGGGERGFLWWWVSQMPI